MKNRVVFIFLVVFAFCRSALAGFQADVSRTVIPEGESFQLYLRQDGDGAQPDISVLNEDFLIVMERKSFKSTYVNGKTQTFNENVLTLIPKKTGEVVLPSIRAGKEQTKPVKLTVVAGGQALPADPSARQKAQAAQPNVFVRYSLGNEKPYIGQQIPLSVKLYSFVQTPLLDGSVTPPQADGVTAEQWGDVNRSRETVNGRTYDVLEYKFLLFAQKSGRIVLSPVRFRGSISDPESRNAPGDDLFGFGGSDLFSGLFGQKNIAVQSSAVILDVQPQPAGIATDGNWLPATDVAVSEDITPSVQTISLGEALTRTVTVMAAGVPDSRLPDLSFPNGSGYKQYPGKTDSKNLFDNDGIVGVKTRQIVFMPTEAGPLVLPKMEIPWFDVEAKQMKKAVLPARTITVKGADNVQRENPPTSVAPVEAETVAATAEPKQSVKTDQSEFAKAFLEPQNNAAEQKAASEFWEKYIHQPPLRLFLAGILAGGAVVTVLWLLFYFLLFRKNVKSSADDQNEALSRRESINRVKEACRSGSADQVKQALLDFGRISWEQNPPLTLTDLAERFDSKELADQLEKLNRVLYAGNIADWDAEKFWSVFKTIEADGRKQKKDEKIPVPPLYPN